MRGFTNWVMGVAGLVLALFLLSLFLSPALDAVNGARGNWSGVGAFFFGASYSLFSFLNNTPSSGSGYFLDTNSTDFLNGTFSNTTVEGVGSEANVSLGGEFAVNGSEQAGYWKFNEHNATPYDQSGLLGWWKFDGNALDSSGNGVDGTETGGVSNATGWLNGAYEFDGSTGYIDLGNTLSVDNELTLSSWAYADSLPNSYNVIVGKWHSVSQVWESYNLIVLPTGAVEIGLTGGQGGEGGTGTWIYCTTTDTPFSTGLWHFVTATWKYSASTCADMHIFIDGVEHANSGPNNGNLASITATGPAYIGFGAGLGTSYWDGKIDNAQVYNRALSASEVEENYLHGSSTRDYSGNGNNGTNHGATYTAAGKFNGALDFDGVDDYVSVPNSAALDFGANDFAVEWWEYRTSSGVSYWASMSRDDAAPSGYTPWLFGFDDFATHLLVYMTSNNAAWDIASARILGTIDLNVWKHFVVTRSGTNFYTYQNGVQQDTWSSVSALANGRSDLEIGKWFNLGHFNGTVDDAIAYNRALSATEVLNHYYLGVATHGTFEKVWDAGANVTWGWFNWSTLLTGALNLTMEVSNSSDGATWSPYAVATSNNPLNLVGEFLKYRANFTGNASLQLSPKLEDVFVNYSISTGGGGGGAVLLNSSNTLYSANNGTGINITYNDFNVSAVANGSNNMTIAFFTCPASMGANWLTVFFDRDQLNISGGQMRNCSEGVVTLNAAGCGGAQCVGYDTGFVAHGANASYSWNSPTNYSVNAGTNPPYLNLEGGAINAPKTGDLTAQFLAWLPLGLVILGLTIALILLQWV